MILHVKDLSKTYRDGQSELPVLKHLSMQLEQGRSLAVMGPSGCGKSTLISCLSGLIRPDGGEIRLQDRDLLKLSADTLTTYRARHIGIIFQQFHLVPHLTALENVRLPLDLNGIKDPEATERSLQALRDVGLANRQNHFPNQLSRGECQRVAIARVLVMKPILILADEPTASLDRATAKDVMARLIALSAQQSASLIIVTHDQEIAELCQSRARFIDGRLEAIA